MNAKLRRLRSELREVRRSMERSAVEFESASRQKRACDFPWTPGETEHMRAVRTEPRAGNRRRYVRN